LQASTIRRYHEEKQGFRESKEKVQSRREGAPRRKKGPPSPKPSKKKRGRRGERKWGGLKKSWDPTL